MGEAEMSESSKRETADDLNIKVCWLYYMEGKTQEEISLALGLNRSKVLRILASARQNGTVQVNVTTEFSRCIELERALEKRLGLERAIVVPNTADAARDTDGLGAALGQYVTSILEDGMTIGLSWGRTLSKSLTHVESQGQTGIKVISMLGGVTRVSGENPSEFAWRMADKLSAECLILAAPVFAPDARTRDALLQHEGIKDIMTAAKSLDLAILGVGSISPHSTVAQYFVLDRDDLSNLQAKGAVGEVLCRFVDANGKIIDHPLNDRVLAIDPRDLQQSKKIVLTAGGWEKYEIVSAAMKLLKPHVLVTDEGVAERLVAGHKP
jgi:DNA-binding transcriptional regulator LsrR (DeoR family)